jgi:Fe-S cluster assembly protein SufD
MQYINIIDNSKIELEIDVHCENDFNYTLGANSEVTLIMSISNSKEIHVVVNMTKPKSSVNLVCLANIRSSGSIKLFTEQNHLVPDCRSNFLVKSVVNDNALIDFHGVINIAENAFLSDSYQKHETLVLSDNSKVITQPILEIKNNDVKCTHGATISPISREQLWYLETRGIKQNDGIKLITRGFLLSPLEKIRDINIKNKIIKEIV